MRRINSEKIFQLKNVPKNEKIRLFCFYYAGGTASFFSEWCSLLSDNIGIYPYELSGHGARFDEDIADSIEAAAEEAAEIISLLSDKPIILFGHSMGGCIAYKTSFLLYSNYNIQPKKIFISASVPNFSNSSKINGINMSKLNDDDFCKALISFDAIDSRIFRVKKFNEVYLPVIRSDFRNTEKFFPNPENKLDCDIQIYGGTEDKIIHSYMLDEWKSYTRGKVDIKLMNGKHFFVRQHIKEICSDIENVAEKV